MKLETKDTVDAMEVSGEVGDNVAADSGAVSFRGLQKANLAVGSNLVVFTFQIYL